MSDLDGIPELQWRRPGRKIDLVVLPTGPGNDVGVELLPRHRASEAGVRGETGYGKAQIAADQTELWPSGCICTE